MRNPGLLVVLLGLIAPGPVRSQDPVSGLRVSVAIASDYKRHGLSQTNSEPAGRIAADFAHRSGFFVGAFVTNVEFESDRFYSKGRDLQASLYAGYLWRRADWATNVSLIQYRYPGFSIDYDYTEIAASVSFRDRYFFDFSRSNDYLSIQRTAYQYRAGLALPLIQDYELGLNAGIFRSSELFGTEYSYWDIGVSRALGRFALDLRYHDNSYGVSSLIGEDGNNRWVFSAAYSIGPR
jgi:uncharacterized protein (TIGR02001 family)